MVKPEHLELFYKKEKKRIEWRKTHPNEYLDLKKAKLFEVSIKHEDYSMIDFSRATFDNCNFYNTDFLGCIFTNVVFNYVDFSFCQFYDCVFDDATFVSKDIGAVGFIDSSLSRCSFQDCGLFGIDFINCELQQTNFMHSQLHTVHFIKPVFFQTNFNGSTIGNSIFSECDLSKCIGLENVKCDLPNSISLDTIIDSFRSSNYPITDGLKKFYLNSGIPPEIQKELPKLISEVEYYSCFICYGSPDEVFAEKLVDDLRSHGVSCWLYSLDYTVGKKTWREITEKRREADKMIVICSLRSLVRPGVKKEIEDQIVEDEDKIIPISLDNDWKQETFDVRTDTMNLKPLLFDKNYANFIAGSDYDDEFKKLLRGILREKS